MLSLCLPPPAVELFPTNASRLYRPCRSCHPPHSPPSAGQPRNAGIRDGVIPHRVAATTTRDELSLRREARARKKEAFRVRESLGMPVQKSSERRLIPKQQPILA